MHEEERMYTSKISYYRDFGPELPTFQQLNRRAYLAASMGQSVVLTNHNVAIGRVKRIHSIYPTARNCCFSPDYEQFEPYEWNDVE